MFRRDRMPLPAGDLGVQDAAWSAVEAGTPDEPVYIRRNHALARVAGRHGIDQMIVIELPFAGADERGLPAEADLQAPAAFEDALAAELGARSFLALVITRAGGRRFVVYSGDEPGVRAAVQAIGDRLGIDHAGYGASPDPDWRFYRQFMALRP